MPTQPETLVRREGGDMSAFKHKEAQTATFSVAESPNRGLVSTHTHTPAHTLAAGAGQLGVRTGTLANPQSTVEISTIKLTF